MSRCKDFSHLIFVCFSFVGEKRLHGVVHLRLYLANIKAHYDWMSAFITFLHKKTTELNKGQKGFFKKHPAA